MGMANRYYSTQRPIVPGSIPNVGTIENITNFDSRIYCEEIGRDAWGFVDYAEPLAQHQVKNYELTPAGVRKYWRVITAVSDLGKVVTKITGTAEATSRPLSSMTTVRRRIIYSDWFDSQEAAQEHMEKIMKGGSK